MKAATKLAIVCLSISALLTFSENWWLAWLSSSEFIQMPALGLVLAAADVLLLQVPLLIFFVTVYRRQCQDDMK